MLQQDPTGVKATPHREMVLRVLAGLPGPATAYAIHQRARTAGERIGLSTVYRHLALLVGAGIAGITRDRVGQYLYHLASGEGQDHHLLCARCGCGIRVDAAVVTRWAAEVAAEHGFSDVRVSASLTGVCPRCRAGDGTSGAGPSR